MLVLELLITMLHVMSLVAGDHLLTEYIGCSTKGHPPGDAIVEGEAVCQIFDSYSIATWS